MSKDCDLCGLPEGEPNEACPQHRMWRLQAENERLEGIMNHVRQADLLQAEADWEREQT